MLRKVKFLALVAMFFVALSASAQVTTSALSGVVTDENQQAMIGATITALHTPSGTKYNVVTDMDGPPTIEDLHSIRRFYINNIADEGKSQKPTGDGWAVIIVIFIVILSGPTIKIKCSDLNIEINSKKKH